MNIILFDAEDGEDRDFICDELLEIGKIYLQFITHDMKHAYMLPAPTLRVFQEIVDQEFDGCLDEAMTEFLIPEFYNLNSEHLLFWMSEHNIFMNGTTRDLLYIMKKFVINCSLDELKEVLGLNFMLK
jgi:hypothetical protein